MGACSSTTLQYVKSIAFEKYLSFKSGIALQLQKLGEFESPLTIPY